MLKIFIDLDGVCAYWEKGACDSLGLNIEDFHVRNQIKKGTMISAIKGISEKELWKQIDSEGQEWWENLELLPWAKDLISLCKEYGEVAILTSWGKTYPKTATHAAAGKVNWVRKHLGDLPIILTYDKYFCASPNSILIDDSAEKLDKFVDDGGSGFMWINQCFLLDDESSIAREFSCLRNRLASLKFKAEKLNVILNAIDDYSK